MSVEIIFENKNILLIILFSAIILIPVIVAQIYFSRRKKNVISLILKILFVALLISAFADPQILYYKNEQRIKKLYVFIDNSLSMHDAYKNGNILSAAEKTKSILKIINHGSKLPVKVFYSTNSSFTDKNLINKYYAFEPENALIECNNKEGGSAVIISDFNNVKIPENNLPAIPIYLLPVGQNNTEAFIKKVFFSKGMVELTVVNNYSPGSAVLNIYSNNKPVLTRRLFLKGKENFFKIKLPDYKIKSRVLKAAILKIKSDKNAKNNEYYFKAKKKKKEKIYCLFSRPSFDTKFLFRFLQATEKYNIEKIIPKSGQKVKFNYNKNYKAVFVGDLWNENIKSLLALNTYVANGGTLIYLHKNSNLENEVFNSLKTMLPFKITDSYFEENIKSIFKPTKYGMNFNFINFKDKSRAAEIWKNFSNLNPVKGKINIIKNAKVLLKYGDKPVLLISKYGKGTVYTVLFQGIWKMDFLSLGYGIKTYFLNIFYNGLIESITKARGKIIYIPEPVIKSGEKIKIIASPGQEKNLLGKGKVILHKNKNTVKNIIFKKLSGIVQADFTLLEPGEYKIILKRTNRVIGKVYVNYPKKELNYKNSTNKNLLNISKNKQIKLIQEKELIKTLNSMKKTVVTKRVKHIFALRSLLLIAGLILLLILAAWYFRTE